MVILANAARTLAFSLLIQLALRALAPLPSLLIPESPALLICEELVGALSFIFPAAVLLRKRPCTEIIRIKSCGLPPHPFLSACAVPALVSSVSFINAPHGGGPVYYKEGASFFYYIILFIAAVPLPAVTEEIFYRGIILSCLSSYNRVFAVTVQAVLFGLLHPYPYRSLYAFCSGLILGILTLECGSVRYAVAVHMLNNALAYFMRFPDMDVFRYTAVIIITAAGICGLALLVRRAYGYFLKYKPNASLGECAREFVTAPPMALYICAVILYYITVSM